MENIEKIFPWIREIKDYECVNVIHIVLTREVLFDVYEQDEIATKIGKLYMNYIFTGEIDLVCNNGGITSYLMYYKNT
jgi:predicted transcriptional regulator